MRKKRQTKWDWPRHWDQMLELYESGQSIPSIHKAIQCEGFMPSQRAVFYKFEDEGLATDHGRGSRPHHIVLQEQTGTVGQSSLNESLLAQMLDNTAPIQGNRESSAMDLSEAQSVGSASQELAQDCMEGVQLTLRLRKQDMPEDVEVGVSFEALRCEEINLTNSAKTDVLEDMIQCTTTHSLDNMLRPKKSETEREPVRKKKHRHSPEDQKLLIRNLQDVGLLDKPKELQEHSGGRTKHHSVSRETDYETFLKRSSQSTSPTNVRPIKKLRSLFKRTSLVGDSDSGYCTLASSSTRSTGRDSFMSVPLSRSSMIINSEPIADFQSPHIVACGLRHEYGIPILYREMEPCSDCGFSKVHNLAVSASRLTLREYEEEIKLMRLSELQAADAARNTALHYAAASGASSAHLKILIEAGVSPYERNTANQNFLHCMRPSKARSQCFSFDCFEMGLTEILGLLDPNLVFSQQDNNGMTVLQALASHITEPVFREEIFRIWKELGLSLHILNRFGRSARDIRSPDYKYPQTFTASSTFKTPGTTTPDLDNSTSEWARKRSKQERAYNTVATARNDPNYVDRMTKDGVLHALSRVNVEDEEAVAQQIDIMQSLKYFVSIGVNLNHHNRDGDHPLSAFICNRDERREDQGNETGPTTAKFLEVLLWKYSKRDLLNSLNDINVDMMNQRGATALFEAATRAQPESVRSLIEAGANVHTRLNDDPRGLSLLQATLRERDMAKQEGDSLREHELKKVISLLKHAKAALEPTSIQQRGGGWNAPYFRHC